jgi:hypothetical protein
MTKRSTLKYIHPSRNLPGMDALTAIGIVAVIGAITLIAAAMITARTRIGLLPAVVVHDASSPFHAAGLPESAKHFRVLGWILVLLLYLIATFCLLQGLNALRIFFHWEQWEAVFGSQVDARSEIELYSRFWIAIGVVLMATGLWAQHRLRRRAH